MVNQLTLKFYKSIKHYDYEDLKQEVEMSIYDAVLKYDDRKDITIESFCYLNALNKLRRLYRDSRALKRDYKAIYADVNIAESLGAQYEDNRYQTEDVETRMDRTKRLKEVLELSDKVLSKSEKLIFTYYYIENLSVEEIMQKTNFASRTIYNLKYAAKMKIKNKINKD